MKIPLPPYLLPTPGTDLTGAEEGWRNESPEDTGNLEGKAAAHTSREAASDPPCMSSLSKGQSSGCSW